MAVKIPKFRSVQARNEDKDESEIGKGLIKLSRLGKKTAQIVGTIPKRRTRLAAASRVSFLPIFEVLDRPMSTPKKGATFLQISAKQDPRKKLPYLSTSAALQIRTPNSQSLISQDKPKKCIYSLKIL